MGIMTLLTLDENHVESVINQLAQRLSASAKTMVTAESCTGGLLATLLTHKPGSSAYYLGGVAAYSNFAKEKFLAVPANLIKTHGAVSKEVAEAMAMGVWEALAADYAISVTGIAGPGGGTSLKPVGTVWCGFCSKAGVSARLFQLSGSREQIRGRVAVLALEHLLAEILT